MAKLFNVAMFVDYDDVEVVLIRVEDDSVKELYQLERKLIAVGKEYFPDDAFTIENVLFVATHDDDGVMKKHGMEIVEAPTYVTNWTEKFN